MTPEQVRLYQANAGLVVDGKLGPITKSALRADSFGAYVDELVGLRGSLGLIVDQEGFKGRAYWPGGASGVTLDYGWDLGHGAESEADLRRLYGHIWSAEQLDVLARALDLQGKQAKAWLARERDGGWEWTITRDQAAQILPRAAGPYWQAAIRACPALLKAQPRVQTALLSVTYSAWTWTVLQAARSISEGDWRLCASWVRASKGDPDRREIEAALIESVIA